MYRIHRSVGHFGRCSYGGPIAAPDQFFTRSVAVSTDQFDSRSRIQLSHLPAIRPSSDPLWLSLAKKARDKS
jgi:hypothetical protein